MSAERDDWQADHAPDEREPEHNIPDAVRDVRCANPTCDRLTNGATYCNRRCQVAMLNNRGFHSPRIKLPMSIVYRLEARASADGMPLEAYLQMLVNEDLCVVDD